MHRLGISGRLWRVPVASVARPACPGLRDLFPGATSISHRNSATHPYDSIGDAPPQIQATPGRPVPAAFTASAL
jgi:hypothetical protein